MEEVEIFVVYGWQGERGSEGNAHQVIRCGHQHRINLRFQLKMLISRRQRPLWPFSGAHLSLLPPQFIDGLARLSAVRVSFVVNGRISVIKPVEEVGHWVTRNKSSSPGDKFGENDGGEFPVNACGIPKKSEESFKVLCYSNWNR